MELTRPQQIEQFFNTHKTGNYNIKEITRYIYKKYFLNTEKTELQLQNEICSNISHMIKSKNKNFTRTQTMPYIYKYRNTLNDNEINEYLKKYYNMTEDTEIYTND